jgi:N6-adenosine-specific RNA methylase IME4
MGRRPIGRRALTAAEKQQRYRARQKHAAKLARREQMESALVARTEAARLALADLPLFNVLYADPAWRFRSWSELSGEGRSASRHYPTMTTDQITTLKIPAADDAVLFLWSTVPMLLDALRVMAVWGFAYKSHLVWVKDRIGTGYVFRNKHELLLYGTKGKMLAPAVRLPSVLEAPRLRHSEKPAAVAEMIERMYPNLPWVEPFARATRSGWETWGNEA